MQSAESNVDLPKDAFDLPPGSAGAAEEVRSGGREGRARGDTTASNGEGGKFTIYMGGQKAASETYTLARSDGKIEIDGSGHAAIGPMKVDIDRFDVVTDDKFNCEKAEAKAKMGAVQINAKITFADGKAKNEVDTGQGPKMKEDAVHPDAVVVNSTLPLYPWTLLGMRAELKNQDPQQFFVYVLNQGEVPATVIFKGREPVEFADKTVELNHLTASGKTPQGQAIGLDFWVDDNRKMIKIAVPSMGVEAYQEGYERKAPPPAPKPAVRAALPRTTGDGMTPPGSAPASQSGQDVAFQAVLDSYLSAILDIAETVVAIYPEIGATCHEQLTRLRAGWLSKATSRRLERAASRCIKCCRSSPRGPATITRR